MTEQTNKYASAPQKEAMDAPVFSIHDILQMMLANWYWFILSVTVCVGCAYLYIASTQSVYNRTATILVKDSRKGGDTDLSAFSDMVGFSARRNVDNEIYILQSRRLMEQVVRQLNLTVNYSTRNGLRQQALYKSSPIQVEFINNNEAEGCAFSVALLEENQISLSNFNRRDISDEDSEQVISGALNDTISTPVGQIIVKPTLYLAESYIGRTVNVSKAPIFSTTNSYRQAVESSVANKMSSIITLSMRDVVPQRAEDVINTLIQVYNNDAMEDKRAITKQTATFINNRLKIISEELVSA